MYRAVKISKQAVAQQQRRQVVFDEQLAHLIVEVDILRADHPGCGIEKMYYTLHPNFIGRDRFIDIFMKLGYRVNKPKNFIKTTFSVYCKYKNLIDGLLVTQINQVVQSDITYIHINGKFYYLVFIIDVYSKRIVGYQASDHLRATANVAALRQLFRLRGKSQLAGMIHHSDRGSQYIASQYIKILTGANCFISMGMDARQNAYAERVNGIIKNEYLKHWDIPDFKTLKSKLRKAVKHYNYHRQHNHLPPRMSPIEFEKHLKNQTLSTVHQELIYAAQNCVNRTALRILKISTEKNQGYFCPIF
ncbi:MAG: transposase [Saprospiraceae bacterium]